MYQERFTDLVVQSQSGDADAMEQLLLLAHTPVSYLTEKILQNPQTAQQITREVLEIVFSKLSTLGEPEHFEQWLCRITAARCIQSAPLLHRNFAEASEPAFWEDNLPDGTELDAEASAEAIQSMVDNLSESQRLCILLLSCGELTIPAIAQLTGFSEGSIRQNIIYGQNIIQQHLWELDSRGIQFTGVSSLTGILHDAMYHHADEQAAKVMVYDILGKKLPVPLSVWAVRLLTVIVVLLLITVLALGGLMVLKMSRSMLA